MANQDLHVPVLIVGASIVGLSEALFLAHHGVTVCAIERHPSTALHPRARGLYERTVELFRASAVAAQLEQLGSITPPVQAAPIVPLSLLVHDLRSPNQAPTSRPAEPPREPFPPASHVYLGQDRVEPILLTAARELGADIRFAHELVDLTVTQDDVTAEVRVRDTDERYRVHAQ